MADAKPNISVVVPAYNAAGTIQEAIDSVLLQTYKHFELIVCDDASTDTTRAIIQAGRDSRIKLLCNRENLGEGPTRDHAISVANGDWIALLDADDAWHPQRLERLVQAGGWPGNTMIFDDIMECHVTNRGLKDYKRIYGSKAFGARNGHSVNVIIAEWLNAKRSLIKPLIPTGPLKAHQVKHSEIKYWGDSEFFLRLIAAGMTLKYVPEAYYYYRITPGSMSSNPDRHTIMLKTLQEIMPLFSRDKAVLDALNRKSNYYAFIQALKNGTYSKALHRFVTNPFMGGELVKRIHSDVAYHLHRLLYRGIGRNGS